MRWSIRAAFATAVLLASASAAQTAAPVPPKMVLLDAADERATAAWVTANAHPFDPGAIGDDVYASIVAALGPAKVYGIGEVTHGTHEDQQFKADLIKAMISAGKIDQIALEANYTTGLAFDRYVKTGVGDPVALIRSTDFFRIWKGDEFASLLTWVRAYNLQAPHPVSFVALDMQLPGRDIPIALDNLAKRDPRAAAAYRSELAPFLAADQGDPPRFSRVWDELNLAQHASATAAAKALLDRFDADAAHHTGAAFDIAHEAARRAWQGMSSFQMVGEKTHTQEEASRRDRYMAENLSRAAGGAHGIAIWAHNTHIAANYEQIYEDMGQLTLGRIVAKNVGTARYRSVGATYSRAHVMITQAKLSGLAALSTAVDDRPYPLANDGPGTAGHLFDLAAKPSHASAMWLNTSATNDPQAPAGAKRGDFFFGEAGWLYTPANFQTDPNDAAGNKLNTYDVLVWFNELTPQHRWPNVPMAK